MVEETSDLLKHWGLGPIRSFAGQEPGEFAAGNVFFIETESDARYVLKRKNVRSTLPDEYRLLAALVSGYETASPLTPVERLALRYILLSIEVIFIAFFLKINHPGGVSQNIEALTWLYANLYEL